MKKNYITLVIALVCATNYLQAQCGIVVPNQNTIYGGVFSDLNQNGQRGGNEPFLQNVGVDLYQDVNANGILDDEDILVDSSVTGVGGVGYYTLVAPEIFINENIADNFDATSWSGNNGSVNWANDWQELGESGVTNGNVRVTGNRLRFGRYTDDDSNITGDGVSRYVNTSNYVSGTLSFDFEENKDDKDDFSVNVQVSTNGTTYTTIDNLGFNDADQNYSYDISSYIGGDIYIRFLGSGEVEEEDASYLYFDNISIDVSKGGGYYEDYLVVIDDSTIPAGYTKTSASVISIKFNPSGLGQRLCHRNFGLYACGPNCNPNAEDDYTSVIQGDSVSIDVLNNDTDGDDNIDISSLVINVQPTNGSVSIDSFGNVIYSPNGNFVGTDNFEYQICDSTTGTPLCDTAIVTIEVFENYIDPCVQAVQEQIYYIPFSDDDLRTAFDNAGHPSSCSSSIEDEVNRVISIKSPYPGTVITYDHWEDGFEADINNPVQATTQVWGDEDITNGTSPNYSTDYIPSGGDIVLENTYIYNPRNPLDIVYDARDKIVTSNDIAMSVVAGDLNIFDVQLAKTDVYSLDKFGTSFTVPFGEDLGNEFQYTSLFIRASEDATTVNVDLDNDGMVDTTENLNEGEVMFIDGLVQSGANITSNYPVGVDLFFGGLDCYGTRQINIYPNKFYSDVYYSPVPTTNNDAPSVVYFYNSLNRSIAIDWNSNTNNGTINIGAKSSSSISLSDNSGYKFQSQDGSSYVASQVIDSDSDGSGFDWSFNLISEDRLTDFAAIAWAPGSTDYTVNVNPVWVTPTANTTLYIKYDGNLTDTSSTLSPCNIPYDAQVTVNALNYVKLFDTINNDNDQSGLAVYTCDGTKIFAVYGQDASLASSAGSGAMDVGTSMQPLCLKALVFANNDIAYSLFDTPIDVNVSYNDAQFLTNLDLSSITTDGLLQPQNGSLIVNDDGTITYTPNTGFIGEDTFEYSICSLEFPGTCDTATVTISVANCPTPSDKNIVYGQVFFDLNEDTINNDGFGLSGIKVDMYNDTNANGVVDASDVLFESKTTNNSGFYNFESPNYNVSINERFNSNDYSGGSGWSTEWKEVGDDGNSASGDVLIWGTKKRLQIKDNKSAYRSVNMAGVQNANISFKVFERGKIDSVDDVTVEICDDNSFTNCQTLFFKANDFRSASINGIAIDVDKLTANTTLRARVNGYTSSDEYFYIDNIVLRYRVSGENLVLEVDTASLPPSLIFSTDNVEVASFATGSFGSCEKSNDFGLIRCNLDSPGVTIICDDNGTPSDASDDGFNISIDPVGTRLGGTYTISGDLSGSGTYGTPTIFGPFYSPDNNFVITITDDSGNCSIEEYQIEIAENYCLFSDSESTIDFDGVDDYIDSSLDLSGYDKASIMAWVKLDNTYNQIGTVINQGDFIFSIDNNQVIKASINNAAINLPTSTSLTNNIWTHIAIIFDSSLATDQAKVYIDGKLVATETNALLTTVINTSSDSFNIGRKSNTTNQYFKGALDEVRIYDIALSESQLQQSIYQEITEIDSNVGGVVIPKQVKDFNDDDDDDDDDDDATISWSNLQAYYQMNDVSKSKTSDSSSYDRTAELNNITTLQEQTAPIPYVTSNDGSWNASSIWLHGNVWNLTELNTSGYAIVKVDNKVTTNSSIECLGLLINDSQDLTVLGDNSVTVNSYLELKGKLDLQQDSQLIQGMNSDLVTSIDGEVLRRQEGTSNVYWYNYFSSPVGNPSVSTLSDNNIANNTNNSAFTLNNLQYGDGSPVQFTNAYNANGSVSSYWLFSFQNGVSYYDWGSLDPTSPIAPGNGYSQKGTGIGTEQQYIFKGKPNNGTIIINAIDTGGDGSDPTAAGGYTQTGYLLGNPYPSALDIHKFIDDNEDVIDGSIKIWQQWSGASHNLSDYNGGYAVVNKLGSVRAYQFVGIEGGIDNSAQDGTLVPTRYLPIGQGFMTEIVEDGDLEFNNSQRIFIKEADADGSYSNGSVFLRTNNNETTTSDLNATFSKFRLFMNADNGASRELVLGFSDETSDSFDYGYDARIESFKNDDLSLVMDDLPMVIQAYSSITTNKVIPLLFKASTDQSFTIRIGDFEGFDEDQDVYIRDVYTNTYHDIKQSDYSFTSQAGTFNDRFEIVFQIPENLSNNDILSQDGVMVFFNNSEDILVISGLKDDIKSISLINMLGQKVIGFNDVTNDEAKNGISITGLSSGAYLVRIKAGESSGTKKIIIE